MENTPNTTNTNNTITTNTTPNAEDPFCNGCHYIFQNLSQISNSNEVITTDMNITEDVSMEKKCKFCVGILNPKNFKMIATKISSQIKNYDHSDYKITTNFSPLFSLLHTYWKFSLKKSKQVELGDTDTLDTSLIRKIFKPFFLPYLEEQLPNEAYNMKSELEIKVIFEFSEKAYDKIYETFSFIQAVKKMGNSKFKPDQNMDRGSINELIKNCSSDLLLSLFNKYNLNDYLNEENLIINVELLNQNVYLKGTYLKFSREIGQSPWEINGVKVCDSSVQEEMKRTLIGTFQCDEVVMSAGGREDRDVRMLGSGRPFIMEIVNPRNKTKSLENVTAIEEKLNANTNLIKVKNLAVCDKSHYAILKKYEDSKQKFYTCLVWVAKTLDKADIEKINAVKDLTIIQKTPIRVMHRRTLMDRKKLIFKCDAEQINENFIIVDVLASAGTYIKEFIHSDLGRTTPSLMTILGCECDILQLDVLDIVYEH